MSTPAAPLTEEQTQLVKDTILHVLKAICNDPAKYYLMGGRFNGSFEKLIAAHAALNGLDPERLFQSFMPNEETYDQWYEEREINERLLNYCREKGITADSED